jgi:hypothetical protein
MYRDLQIFFFLRKMCKIALQDFLRNYFEIGKHYQP